MGQKGSQSLLIFLNPQSPSAFPSCTRGGRRRIESSELMTRYWQLMMLLLQLRLRSFAENDSISTAATTHHQPPGATGCCLYCAVSEMTWWNRQSADDETSWYLRLTGYALFTPSRRKNHCRLSSLSHVLFSVVADFFLWWKIRFYEPKAELVDESSLFSDASKLNDSDTLLISRNAALQLSRRHQLNCKFADRSFASASSTEWNRLPESIRRTNSQASSDNRKHSFLFSEVFELSVTCL